MESLKKIDSVDKLGERACPTNVRNAENKSLVRNNKTSDSIPNKINTDSKFYHVFGEKDKNSNFRDGKSPIFQSEGKVETAFLYPSLNLKFMKVNGRLLRYLKEGDNMRVDIYSPADAIQDSVTKEKYAQDIIDELSNFNSLVLAEIKQDRREIKKFQEIWNL